MDSPEQADGVTAVYHKEGAAWVTIVSDGFNADVEKQTVLAKALSSRYDAPALAVSCFDSDFLMLNWLDAHRGHDLFASSGSAAAAGMKGMCRSNFAAWRKVLPDAEAFAQVMRRRYTLAEEAVADLPGVHLYYYVTAEKTAELPRFVKDVLFADSWNMLQYNGDNLASFYNAGGDPCGVLLLLAGDDLTGGALTLTGAKFGYINGKGASVHISIRFERVMFPDGVERFRAEMIEHRVRGVPEGLPPKKHDKVAFDRGFFLIFTLQPKNPERTEYAPVFAYTIPSKNWAGQGAEVFRQ